MRDSYNHKYEMKFIHVVLSSYIEVVEDINVDECPCCGKSPQVIKSVGSNCGADEYRIVCVNSACHLHDVSTNWVRSIREASLIWSWHEKTDKRLTGNVSNGYTYTFWHQEFLDVLKDNPPMNLEIYWDWKCPVVVGCFAYGMSPKKALEWIRNGQQIGTVLF